MGIEQQKTNSYRNTEVNTASPMKLVVLLYDAAISKIDISINNMDFKTYDVVNKNLQKVTEIIAELETSLNMELGGEIAKNLKDIYIYISQKVNEGNRLKKIEPLQEANKYLRELRTSWNQIAQNNPVQKKQARQNNVDGGISGLNIKG